MRSLALRRFYSPALGLLGRRLPLLSRDSDMRTIARARNYTGPSRRNAVSSRNCSGRARRARRRARRARRARRGSRGPRDRGESSGDWSLPLTTWGLLGACESSFWGACASSVLCGGRASGPFEEPVPLWASCLGSGECVGACKSAFRGACASAFLCGGRASRPFEELVPLCVLFSGMDKCVGACKSAFRGACASVCSVWGVCK